MKRFFNKEFTKELIKYLTSREYLTKLALTITVAFVHGFVWGLMK